MVGTVNQTWSARVQTTPPKRRTRCFCECVTFEKVAVLFGGRLSAAYFARRSQDAQMGAYFGGACGAYMAKANSQRTRALRTRRELLRRARATHAHHTHARVENTARTRLRN